MNASFPAVTDVYPYPEASRITVGDRFYQLVARLPVGTSGNEYYKEFF